MNDEFSHHLNYDSFAETFLRSAAKKPQSQTDIVLTVFCLNTNEILEWKQEYGSIDRISLMTKVYLDFVRFSPICVV